MLDITELFGFNFIFDAKFWARMGFSYVLAL